MFGIISVLKHFFFRNTNSGDAKIYQNKNMSGKVIECATIAFGDAAAEVYPDFCHSQKEKECWKLFQKMLLKGVTVSYDTILRGMLTPTELRAVQKQKTIDEQRQNDEAEAAAAAAEAAANNPTKAS